MNHERDMNDLIPIGTIVSIRANALWRAGRQAFNRCESSGEIIVSYYDKEYYNLSYLVGDQCVTVIGKLLTKRISIPNVVTHSYVPTTVVVLGNGEVWWIHTTHTLVHDV
jgi:hypothetical protein